MRVSLILWDGNVGGAEKVTAELAGALRSIGVDATVVFVRDPKSLAADLDRLSVPYVSFGARRVEEVLWHPRRFARLVEEHGADGALLPAVGHLAPALRIGGYRRPLVAMEHGFLLLMDSMAPHWRLARTLERRFSAPYTDAQVAVSEFMRARMMRSAHARRVEVIENGIDLDRYESAEPRDRNGCVFGFASRLIDGKGVPELIEAFARVATETGQSAVRLRIAGDGPLRGQFAELVERHDVAAQVELAGVVSDMPSFWHESDVAVMPSTAPESFGMVALEAMASSRPVIATRSGGADCLVADGVTGQLVPSADVDALAAAMLTYAADPSLRREHGGAGRERCEAAFTMTRCARRYADLLATLGGSRVPTITSSEAPREEVHV
jgi:glycosyltransferase involved in cell wall biosynthesis